MQEILKLRFSTASAILGNGKDLCPCKSHCHQCFQYHHFNCEIITSGGNAYHWLLVTWNTSSLKTCNKMMVQRLQHRNRIHMNKTGKPTGLNTCDWNQQCAWLMRMICAEITSFSDYITSQTAKEAVLREEVMNLFICISLPWAHFFFFHTIITSSDSLKNSKLLWYFFSFSPSK